MVAMKGNVRIVEADSPDLLEKVHSIREEVFIVEQKVPHDREYDEFEDVSFHYLALIGDEPAGCVRYRSKVDLAKIERLAVLGKYRGRGVGKMLMEHVENAAVRAGHKGFVLNSQCVAIPFYEECGYEAIGPIFLDAGIEHREMRKGVR